MKSIAKVSLLLILLIACHPKKFEYPNFSPKDNIKDYFGLMVNDEYALLENSEIDSISRWYAKQDSLAESFFRRLSIDEKLQKEYENLDNRSSNNVYGQKLSENGNIFFQDYDWDEEAYNLYFKKDHNSEQTLLFDISKYKDGTYTINDISPFFDGSLIAVAIGKEDAFKSSIIVIDVASRKIISKKNAINAAPNFAGGIQWLSRELFTYLYFPTDEQLNNYKENSFSIVYNYKSGSSIKVFGNTEKTKVSKNYYPIIKTFSSKERHAIGHVGHAGKYWDSYIIDKSDLIKGKSNWKPFFTKEDSIQYDYGILKDNEYYFLQDKNEKVTLSNFNIKNESISISKILSNSTFSEIISSFLVLDQKLYLTKQSNGTISTLYELNRNGIESNVVTPFVAGSISLKTPSNYSNKLFVELSGWTNSASTYLLNQDNEFVALDFPSKATYPEFDSIIAEQIEVEGHDKVKIPLTVVRNKDLQYDKSNKVFLEVYGSYGSILTPNFSIYHLNFVNKGGVLAYAHVRGGGAKGPMWHEDGMKSKKANSWKDLISCANYLTKIKLSTSNLITLYTTSAGGITAAMALNESPESFGAFIARSPRLNPIRLENNNTSSSSFEEYGSISNEKESKALIEMDPYVNLSKSHNYPPTLIFPSFSDDRIPISDSGKFIAKLQGNSDNRTPYLLDINYKDGHNHSTQYYEQFPRIFAFIATEVN